MLDDLRPRDVIYLGEYHTIPRHHQLEEELIVQLANGKRGVVVAFEHFEFPQQGALDRFGRGEIDVKQLAVETDLARRWPGYTNYLNVLKAAQKAVRLCWP